MRDKILWAALAAIAVAGGCILANAGPLSVQSWTANPAQPDSHVERAYQGEKVRLQCAFPGADFSEASAEFLWATNGAAGWWTAPATATGGVVFVDWGPSMDCGASSYRFFFRVVTDGASYRANGTIIMLPSPGAEPNALPLPARAIDFAQVSVTNAPWALPYVAGDNIVIINGVISSTGGGGGGVSVETDPVWEAEKGLYATKAETDALLGEKANLNGDADESFYARDLFTRGNLQVDGNLTVDAGVVEYFGGVQKLFYHDDEVAVRGDIELHEDTFGGIVWQTCYSNGWVFLRAKSPLTE